MSANKEPGPKGSGTEPKKPPAKAGSAPDLDRVRTLIAYVSDPHPDGIALPDDIRREILAALEYLGSTLQRGAAGRPSDRRLCARILYELIVVHGADKKRAIDVALKLAGRKRLASEGDTVHKLYRELRNSEEFRAIALGPGLQAAIVATLEK